MLGELSDSTDHGLEEVARLVEVVVKAFYVLVAVAYLVAKRDGDLFEPGRFAH